MGLDEVALSSTKGVSIAAALTVYTCLTVRSHLACIGAVIMILSLVFDTFTQQLVGVTYHNIPDPQGLGAGQVQRSNYWNNYIRGDPLTCELLTMAFCVVTRY